MPLSIRTLSVATLLLSTGVAARGATFTSGVACGDVTPDSAVLWTRTAEPASLRVEVALADDFSTILFEAVVATHEESDTTAKIVAENLPDATGLVYRFVDETDGTMSPVGRFTTAPTPETPAAVRFVFSGASNFRYAPLHVLNFAAQENADFFLWLGDTMYSDVPSGDLGVAESLDEYRAKYRQLRSDPALQGLLAAGPTLVVWDDHEVTNDYAGGDPGDGLSREQIEAAYTAFFEHMPVPESSSLDDPFRIYRRIRWGSRVELFLLDGRQYRDADASDLCDGNPDPHGLVLPPFFDADCLDALSAPRTMLGPDQLAWLKTGLMESDASAKFIVSNVPFSFFGPLPYDRWDGYDAERKELLEFIDANGITGVWILTTDLHLNVFNPDVNSFFRRFRPDMALRSGIRVPEVITGPIATNTFEQEALSGASAILGLDGVFGAPRALSLLFESVMGRIRRRNEFSFLEPNRFAYVVVDVSADGQVDVTFRGIAPDATDTAPESAETLFTTLPSPVSTPCGTLGLLPVLLTAVGLGLWRGAGRSPSLG